MCVCVCVCVCVCELVSECGCTNQVCYRSLSTIDLFNTTRFNALDQSGQRKKRKKTRVVKLVVATE